MSVGIRAISVCAGDACVDVHELARHRGLDMRRFSNLLMKEKTVALPYEDSVTYAVNAAQPILDGLAEKERNRIQLLITCSESGVDFAKSLSTYVHDQLGLQRRCRLFEIKQACYAGTAGLQMAVSYLLSDTSPEALALVIATDITRPAVRKGTDVRSQDWAYAEPSSGAGAVALLLGADAQAFQIDHGASGYYGREIMDTCRPAPDTEVGDAELSLMSYLECCKETFLAYRARVDDVDYANTFHYLAFHTPFGGMVRGAHRAMMREFAKADTSQIDTDFERRVLPGLNYCQRVGNIMSATVLLSLASTIDNGKYSTSRRIGCYSYGSGCCAEFYSGVVTAAGQKMQREFDIEKQLDRRCRLSMAEYDEILEGNLQLVFGTRNQTVSDLFRMSSPPLEGGRRRLVLKEVRDFHRKYRWES